jgi:hypothetical protein
VKAAIAIAGVMLVSSVARAQDAPAAPAAPAPPPVDVTAWVQIDVVPWAQDSLDELDPATRAPLDQERLIVRRARLRAETGRGDFHGALELDGNTVSGPVARLLSATGSWSPDPAITVTAGLFKIPFGADVPQPDRARVFLEPGWAARALFPGNYDGGVMASGGWRFTRYAIAIMNGAPSGDAQFGGRDPTRAPDLVGRAGVDVDLDRGVRVRGGLSALVGTGLHPGTPPTKDQLQWIDANEDGVVQTTELMVIPGGPGEPSKTFDRNALAADAAIDWTICACGIGRGEAFAEVSIATNLDRAVVVADPVAASRDLRELGWQVGVWQEVTERAWAGVRYDAYRPDRDASEVEGAALVPTDPRFSTLALMAAARWSYGRVTVEYDHQRNPLGRRDDGQPGTRAADRVTVRAQVEW